jgi:cytochrome P450
MTPFMDPPDHTRIRKILQPYFTPRAIEQLRAFAVRLVDSLLDQLAAQGGGDLVADFAQHIPVAVVCEILGGMGAGDQASCRAWTEGLVEAVHPMCDEEMMRRADDAATGFRGYFMDLLSKTPAEGDNLLRRLLQARDDGDIDEEELLATATSLVGAAYHNTRNHIATAIWMMLRHPDQLALLREDPDRTPAAVEEVLRYDPPVQVTLPRLARRDVTVGGVQLHEGEQVAGFLGGANRDPARYQDPERFDILRSDAGSLSLASGTHSCIGAAMARMESDVALRGFFGRFDAVTLIDENPVVDLPGLPSTRGFTSIRIEL